MFDNNSSTAVPFSVILIVRPSLFFANLISLRYRSSRNSVPGNKCFLQQRISPEAKRVFLANIFSIAFLDNFIRVFLSQMTHLCECSLTFEIVISHSSSDSGSADCDDGKSEYWDDLGCHFWFHI